MHTVHLLLIFIMGGIGWLLGYIWDTLIGREKEIPLCLKILSFIVGIAVLVTLFVYILFLP